MNGSELKLALRIQADMQQARRDIDLLDEALGDVGDTARRTATDLDAIDTSRAGRGTAGIEALGSTVADVGAKAQAAAQQFQHIGETAEQQEARIRGMVAASLEQRSALDAVAAANQRAGGTAREAAADWQATAAAQSSTLNAHTAAERAAEQHALAEQKAAAAASQAAAAFDKQAAELGELLGRIDPVIRELERLDGLEQRLKASRASGAVDLATYDRYNAKLQAQRVALTGNTEAMKLAGISAGQYQQAMRQLPMQLTDITTSLASGMPVWMVAVQQGGQIKDSFGGWGNAARALVATINPLTVAIAAATAVAGGFFLALEAGSRQHGQFNEALILTDNYAGQTSATLEALARSAAGAGGLGRARDILTGLAAGGRIGAEGFDAVGRAAVAMAELTGQSADQVVNAFSRMTDDVARWAVETDRQYHFLNTGALAQIQSLQEQGRATDAAKIAADAFFEAATARSKELQENLTSLERAWKGLGGTIKSWWEEIKDFAAETAASFTAMSTALADMSNADLTALLRQQEALSGFQASPQRRRELDERIAAIRAELQAREQLAQAQAADVAAEQRANDALQSISQRRQENLTREERKQRELNKLAADYVALWNEGRNAALPQLQGVRFEGGRPAGGQFEVDRQRIEERYRDPAARQQQSAYAELNRQITERIATLNAATDAQTKLSDAQRFAARLQATIADGTVKLTAAEKEQLQVRLQALAAADELAQAQQDTRALADAQLQYLRAIGDGQAVAQAEIEKRWGDLIRRLEARGDQDGRALIEKLLNVQHASRQVEELQRRIREVLAEQSRGEQQIQVQREAGLLSETGARQKLVDLSQRTADRLQAIRPDLEALQGAPGEIGRQAGDALAALDNQAMQLRATTDLLSQTLRTGFEDGLTRALDGLATGTLNLQEAVRGLGQAVASALSQMASQHIAEQISQSVGSLFGGGGEDAGAGTAAAIAAAGTTAATTMGSGIATGGGTAATAMATAITAAGTQAATVMAAAITSASAGSSTADTVTDIVGAFAGAGGKAIGGLVRGPGTGTSDSIPTWLSNEEFVTRAAVVRQPGALPFLHDFNRHGMAALTRWSAAVRHATGGLAGVPAPEMPAPGRVGSRMEEPAKMLATTVQNAVNLHVYDDPQRIADAAFNSRTGEENFYLMLSRNPGKVRSALNINGG